MKFTVLLFSILSCSFAVPASNFGGRIIGGYDIPIEEIPYQISLQRDGIHNCGGSIIAPNFVVTAAHCTSGLTESRLSVRAGTSIRENGGQLLNVKKIYNHPLYDGFVDYDIAVLELSGSLVYGDTVAPIALPNRSQTWPAGTQAITSGWGYVNPDVQSFPVNLQGLKVDLVDRNTCSSIYRGVYTDRMICAGGEANKGICTCDSGGPLQVGGFLAGVVSFSTGCGRAGYPGAFASVSVLRDFIEEVSGL